MLDIELLYFGDCLNYRKACDMVCEIVGERNLDANIRLTAVTSVDNPAFSRFRGSPTILVNGMDVEMCFNAEKNSQFDDLELFPVTQLACRTYDCAHDRGCPTREMIECALGFE